MNTSLVYVNVFLSLFLKFATQIEIGETLDLAAIDYEETLSALDEDLTKIFTLPCQDEGETLMKKMSTFAHILSLVKEDLRVHDSKVFPLARNIHSRGKPQFLSCSVSRNVLFLVFKWSPEEAGLFDFVYHDCETLWNDFENIYKVHEIDFD